jgi:hypothetical protein
MEKASSGVCCLFKLPGSFSAWQALLKQTVNFLCSFLVESCKQSKAEFLYEKLQISVL